MIPPNELRIGNWVDLSSVGATQILNGHDIDIVYKNAKPILIEIESIASPFLEKKENNLWWIKGLNKDFIITLRRVSEQEYEVYCASTSPIATVSRCTIYKTCCSI